MNEVPGGKEKPKEEGDVLAEGGVYAGDRMLWGNDEGRVLLQGE